MKKDYKERLNAFYKEMFELGREAEGIITAFVREHGGNYEIDTETDDPVWVDNTDYAERLATDANGNIEVHTSGGNMHLLHNMPPYDVLDLANFLNNK